MHSDFKNKVIFTAVVLFIAAAFLVITLPPKRINLKSPAVVAPHTTPKKPTESQSNPITKPETNSNQKTQIDYYIIVGTFKNLTLAREKAAKLKNDFNTDIIILPPTAEGYYRVSYGKYSTHEEAKSIIKNLSKSISSDAWVFSDKK
jgi:cell division septation protein DedD